MPDIPKIDIRPDHWEIVRSILQKHVPQHAVWAFGSRAKWTAKEYSDLDLAIITNKPLSLDISASLSDDFSESDLPYKVDVVDWATTGESFRKIIERDKVVVQEGGRGMASRTVAEFAARTAIGPFGSRMKSDAYTELGVPVIRGTNLTGGKVLSGEWVYVSDKTADDLANCCVYPGDIVFPHRGAIGEVGIVPDQFPRYVMSSSLMTLSCDRSKADPDYVYYFFKSATGRHELLKNASQVGTPGIGQPLSTLRSIEVPLPPPSLQRVIAKTLGDLDSKINLNSRINQTLEAMAQAIFKSWFVDFDPVKAKVAAIQQGRDPLRAAMSAISGKPDAELDGLPPEQYEQLAATAALFPEEMEVSELGEIPRAWFVRALPDCIDVNPPRTLKKGSVARYLDMANVPTNSARVQNVVPREFTSGSKFKNGDTLLARITPCLENGKTAFVDFLNGDEVGWGSTEFIVLRPKNRLPEPFAYFLCRYPDFRAFAIAQMAGTSGRQRVPNDCFGGYKLVEPAEPVAIEFGRLARAALNQIKALDEEAKTLASLRDYLLPKLLSGELPVSSLAELPGAA